MFEGKKIGAVIPAGGRGRRIGGARPKQLIRLLGKPILLHTLERFELSPEIDTIVISVSPEIKDEVEDIVRQSKLSKVSGIVNGGEHRQDSVWNGIDVLEKERVDYILIHDAVRPFVTAECLRGVISESIKHGAAVVAVRPKDTVKQSAEGGFVGGTLERENVWIAQTPQGFQFSLIHTAFCRAREEGIYATDDSSLVERLGIKVRIVEGSYDNLKISTAEDLEFGDIIARRFLAAQSRTGY